MSASYRSILMLSAFLLLAGTASAQLCTMRGKVIGEDGAPLQGAVIRFETREADKPFTVKTNKKGEYFHGGLPFAKFRVVLVVNGKDVDHVDNVQTQFATEHRADFDLQLLAKRKAELMKAASTGQLTKEQKREFGADEISGVEQQIKEQARIAAKNKELGDAFVNGRTALQNRQFDEALAQLTKASEMAPNEPAAWIYLAEANVQFADTKTGTERETVLEKACEHFRKAIQLKDNDAVFHNKYAMALTKLNKTAEAQSELEKAAALDPANAGKYYFNLGAMLTNMGQTDASGAAYKKAVDANPDLAEAQFQYAIYLSSKMPAPGADGKVVAPPGMKEALEKYLQLEPNGANADSAKALIAMIGTSIQTTFENPTGKKPAKKR